MRSVMVVAAACALAACYDPAVRDCTIACSSGDACVPGQVCGADGFCAAPSVAGRCAELDRPGARESPKQPDARPGAPRAARTTSTAAPAIGSTCHLGLGGTSQLPSCNECQ